MNGLLALCHFCELHGPSVVFCTQAFHLHPAGPAHEAASAESSGYGSAPPPEGFTTVGAAGGVDLSTPPRSAGLGLSSIEGDGADSAGGGGKAPVCNSCASLPEHERGYVTNDYETHTTYLSTRNPINSKLYSIVRQACVQSLSCEINPGREGPVMFGDEQNGYVLSYMFKIRDSQARGMTRHYSFILLMTDRIFLVASWPFLVGNFRQIAVDIQQRAERTYDHEISQKRKEAASTTGFNRIAPIYSDQFIRRRSGQSLRTLLNLMGSQDFFAQLHACCSWILRSSGSRLYEKQLTGHPLVATAPSSRDELPSSATASRSLSSEGSVMNDSKQFKLFPGLQFDSLMELRRILRPDGFGTLVYNVVVGNQVIVRGEAPSVVESILRLLRELIPPACCNMLLYETAYQESYRCNFLGLAPSAEVPAHVDRNAYVLLDVKYDAYDDYVGNVSGLHVNYDQQIERFRQFFFLVSYGIRGRAASVRRSAPVLEVSYAYSSNSFTTQLESIMGLNPSLQMLDLQLMILKEDWMGKAKLFFKFSRSPDAEGDDKLRKFVKILGVKESDLPLLRFWMSGLDRKFRARLLAM